MISSNQNETDPPQFLGIHILADFWDCEIDEASLDYDYIIREAAKRANNEVLKYDFFKFSPQGYTAFAILGESHISIHTWPEKRYCAIDVFTCGAHAAPEKAIEYLKEQLKPNVMDVNTILRGKSNVK